MPMQETVRWLELDRGRRHRVSKAVRKGRAVDDPRDAPYAVGFADASLDWLSWKRRFRPVHLLLLTLVLAELVLTGGWRPALVLYPLVGFTYLRLRAPRLRKRVTAARELNVELAQQLRLSAVSVQMPGQAFFRPGSRLRRRLLFSFVLVVAGALALAVAATAWTIRDNHRWATSANPICAREQGRLSALRDRQLDPIARQLRWNAIERETLVAFDGLKAHTRLQRQFVAWRRYELELGVWLVGRLRARDDYWILRGHQRLESARETARRIARLIGAKTCADV
jgi:hypothetical protein